MKGSYEVIVQNRRLKYRFTVSRNITILRGDSATGKTTLIEMIRDYQENGMQSGVSLSCKKACVVLAGAEWQTLLEGIADSIVFIDEGNPFVSSQAFANAVKHSSNYYVIATRNNLFNLPYSVSEIYGIKNIGIYLPESFEWLVLKANLTKSPVVSETLANPSDHIDSGRYLSWELFFTDLLTETTHGTYLEYSKKQLNPAYLQEKESEAITAQMPAIFGNER